MPIGKNALKRVANNGYAQLKSTAPDMENSVVLETEAPAEPPKKAAKKAVESIPTPKKTTEKKPTATKKPVEKKATAKPAETKKTAEKKPVAAKKTAEKKAVEKPVEKKPAAKKAVVKKSAPKAKAAVGKKPETASQVGGTLPYFLL